MPTQDDHYNTALTFNIQCKFADGVELVIEDTDKLFDNGVMIEGDKGRLFVNRGKITGSPIEDLAQNPLADDAITKACKGFPHGNHMQSFFTAIKTRQEPISDVWSHHRALTTCHLANIAIRLDRKIVWDTKTEQIIGDDEANAWQHREQRKGYEIDG